MTDNKKQIVYKKTAELIPYINNARTHSDEQVKQISASINEFGFTNPVLIDENNTIIAGHGRVLAAQKIGLELVPTIELSNLSKAQKKAYILADNKLALNAGWDDELLKLELEDLKSIGFDVGLTGFDGVELDNIFDFDKNENPDTIEEVSPELPGAQALKIDMQFPSKLPWGMPELIFDKLSIIPNNIATWAGRDATPDDGESFYIWNWRTDSLRGCPKDRMGIAFYTDDYRFDCLWDQPSVFVAKMLNLGCSLAVTPNFSLWSDQAEAIHIFATYKSRWLGRYMQEAGINVIPDVNWASEKSFEFCLLGIPKNLPAISVQLQTIKTNEEIKAAINGLSIALKELNPTQLLVYGHNAAKKVIDYVGFNGEVVFLDNRTALRRKVMNKKGD